MHHFLIIAFMSYSNFTNQLLCQVIYLICLSVNQGFEFCERIITTLIIHRIQVMYGFKKWLMQSLEKSFKTLSLLIRSVKSFHCGFSLSLSVRHYTSDLGRQERPLWLCDAPAGERRQCGPGRSGMHFVFWSQIQGGCIVTDAEE